METLVDQKAKDISLGRSQQPLLFQVWIDLHVGGLVGPPEWWWNSPPKPLADALDEAAKARESDWVCVVMPEGTNPRPDGRWDNPCPPELSDLLQPSAD